MFNSYSFINEDKSYIYTDVLDNINNFFSYIFQENNIQAITLSNLNNNESLDEDMYNFINKDNPSVPNNEIKLNDSETNEEKSTNSKTNKDNPPKFFSKDEILNMLLNDEIKKKFMNSNINKSDEYYYLEKGKKKRKEDNENFGIIKKNEEEEKKSKRGRKKNSISMNVHDRMVPDNIIKKIKSIIFKYILTFLNNLLKKGTNFKITFLNLDYKKYINKLNISFEKELLSMKLKDLLSLDISSKYKKKEDNNKATIETIEKEGEKIINKDIADILKFILDITLRDWLDLFTGKKQIKELYDVNELSIKFDMIEKSFVGINGVLNNFKKEDEKYFASFVLFFFNYERWFLIKTPRGVKNKMNEI